MIGEYSFLERGNNKDKDFQLEQVVGLEQKESLGDGEI